MDALRSNSSSLILCIRDLFSSANETVLELDVPSDKGGGDGGAAVDGEFEPGGTEGGELLETEED